MVIGTKWAVTSNYMNFVSVSNCLYYYQVMKSMVFCVFISNGFFLYDQVIKGLRQGEEHGEPGRRHRGQRLEEYGCRGRAGHCCSSW